MLHGAAAMIAASPWIAVMVALFIWWFSTGAILMVVKRADRAGGDAHLVALLWGLPFLVFGVVGYAVSLADTTVMGVYLGFFSALALWGWIELAFLTGRITGPNRAPCPPGLTGFARFRAACATLAWHELLLAATLLAMVVSARGAENLLGVWVFATLFVARISAKLNLFLGVPRINTEFLTEPLAHLPSYFRRATLNELFPLSITILSFATALWLERLLGAGTPAEVAGFALLTALTALALLEHWFMILPLPDARLWRWMLPARAAAPSLPRNDT